MSFKKFITLLLSLLMVISMTACSGGGGGETPEPSGETKYKTTFTYAVGGEPTYMDPAKCGDSVTAEIHNEIWYPLFYLTETGAVANGDCIDWSVDDSGTVYTFKLDPKEKWSDGVPVTADQYVYGIKRCIGYGFDEVGYLTMITNYILNAEKHVGEAVADMDDVGVKAVDDYTLEITLNAKCPFFVSLLPTQVFAALRPEIAPEKDSEWSSTPGYPTTGAFVPTKIDSASEYILEKNPNFARADEVIVEKMIAKIMPSMEASQMAFQTGEIDYDTSAGSDVVNNPTLKENVRLNGNINYYMNLNCYTGPEALQNRDVRRAIQLGIDRGAFVTALDAGDMFYELYGFVPVGLPDWDGSDFRTNADNDHKLVYTDKEEAKRLMESAGFNANNRLALTYYYNQNAMHDTVAAVIRDQLKDIYIDVTLKTAELRTFFDDRSYGRYDMARNAFSADYMDPWNYMELMAIYNDPEGRTFFGDETYDKILFESMELEGKERFDKLHEAEVYAIETMCFNCPLFGYGDASLEKTGTIGVINNPQANHIFWFVKCPE
ncbi:MAG: peptide ABC transporter substrate-binding protein [Erysipelotrichaceae bacterium]|nr:peptide ABC transporter substrate-binding protein [Erysipelotrichaceae bacterium]